ncbi:MAG: NAD(P)/FAD-dependent oxidoreductase [Candidatus Heimdallarchaeaceae archaeon]
MSKNVFDLVIIGAGISGMSAALGAFFANPQITLKIFGKPFESNTAKQGEINNFPGYKKIIGVEFIQNIVDQVRDLGIEVSYDEVKALSRIGEEDFLIETENGRVHAKRIILATGLPELKNTIKGEEQFEFKGVSYCAVCDGALFRGKKVAILGYGNVVGRGTLFLRKYCRKITVLCPKEDLGCDGYYMNEIEKSENIKVVYNVEPLEVYGTQLIQGIKYKTPDGETHDLSVHSLFIELKDKPDLSILKGVDIKLNNDGFVSASEIGETNIKGLYAVGAIKGLEDYAVIHAGDGFKVGLIVGKELKNE